ncbi:haloacid dehalogenase-like hydrolase [Marinobacter litoralis]|uniref:phosphoglycolate phosphatase n=1 Tax=Marinobacter litoralis TaxID=187981 RepID=A0A3M2R915_9GAMM|nr:HAD hydrolase-like protein [Marinobacter litoralis]RMJ01780.1 haloacid dehalogenase-like hydrolase [Marinobacter litoralis]
MKSLPSYSTWVFDCDGVLLNSNVVKTEAFYRSAEPYGRDKADALVAFHIANGGVSRYVKFEYFLTDIVGRDSVDTDELQLLLDAYAGYVRNGLMNCEVAAGLDQLKKLTPKSSWMVVSGGDQEELRWVFAARGIDVYFDGGIYGSPQTKDQILAWAAETEVLSFPAVFVGDSQYDFEAASRADLDFIFVSAWSESSFDFKGADYSLDDIGSIVAAVTEGN